MRPVTVSRSQARADGAGVPGVGPGPGHRRGPWRRPAGFVITIEMLLILTVVVIAILVALAAVRNALIASGAVLAPVLVYDSSAPDQLLVGRVLDLDPSATPQVPRRDPNTGLSVPLGIRPRRFTSHAPVFYGSDDCAGAAFVTGPGFLLEERVDYYHQLHGVAYAVAVGAVGGPGLLVRDDGSAPCMGAGCPAVASVWISEWQAADAAAPGAPPPSASFPSPLNPCRDLVDGPRDGLVPAVEVIDPATSANVLSRFTPPFVLR